MALLITIVVTILIAVFILALWLRRFQLSSDLQLHKILSEFRAQFDERQFAGLKLIQDTLTQNSELFGQRVDKLTQQTDQRLKEISGQVEKRLSEGFEKTTATFADVVKRLAMIDAAQKKITELSSSVVSLQEVLTDKRSRGAFGEVQLAALLHNMLPEAHFELQCTLGNGKRADCILKLPAPTGNVVIDAKFPLESYKTMMDQDLPESERMSAKKQFQADIHKHIQDIADKYIIAGETSDGAMMFIPAEAVFAEIHAHFPKLVDEAHKKRVWMVSPTTMMAILTTARAVLKDEATRKQVHIIQMHLRELEKDFSRFETRMDKLAQHIRQSHEDVDNIHTSARKITAKFKKIDSVELGSDTLAGELT
jgi:DNA recombination protein RmuC